jgi:hypothetical protein
VISPQFADHAWYASTVLALCPPIAVLGSRRPGTRVWAGFILFPMLLALGWPIGALWLQGSELRGLQLETPQLVAFCLVLVMGVGNYFGTRFTLSGLIYFGSALAMAVSSSAVCPGWLNDRTVTRFWCTAFMALAVILTKTLMRPATSSKFDRLWFDFFDAFGIVWGRRIQDRVNFIAEKERLPVRLELEGFIWTDTSHQDPITERFTVQPLPISQRDAGLKLFTKAEVEARIEHILRWLLRRFVDPAWINGRLDSMADATIKDLNVDS